MEYSGPLKRIIVTFTGFLLFGFLVIWWIFELSEFNIPRLIPNTAINIEGLFLIILIFAIYIPLDKKLLETDSSITIWQITLLGILVCLIAEFVFQAIRQTQMNADNLIERIKYFIIGVFGMSLFSGILSLYVAFIIKRKKTFWLLLVIAALLTVGIVLKSTIFIDSNQYFFRYSSTKKFHLNLKTKKARPKPCFFVL